MLFPWFPVAAHADEPPDPNPGAAPAAEEIEVVHARDATFEAERGSASVTVVPIDERLPASADLPSVVALSPGAVVRRLGGLGAYSTVSIRGSTARQVEVVLDGVPLNPDGAATVNLSELPLAALSRVEVFRGNAPIALGAAPIGGVVHLVTTDAPVATAALTAGTLDTFRASAAWQQGPALVAAEALTSAGDFRYLDDGGTPYVAGDDAIETRQNADRAQGALHARLRFGDDRLRLTLLNGLLVRDEGVPGFVHAPSPSVRYGVVRDLQSARVEGTVGATRLTALGWVQARRERLDDPLGEIGLDAARTDDTTVSPGLRGTVEAAPAGDLALTGLVEIRGDRYVGRDLLAGVVDPARSRAVGRSAAGARWAIGPLTLTPAVVGTLLASDGEALSSLDPRLGARLDLDDRLAITANVGRYLRPPDLTELFGDRGPLVGNPDLRPERGAQGDLGLRWAGERARVELVAFHGHAVDRIAWVQNAQQVAMPVNLEASRVTGLEAAASLRLGPIESWTALTRTWSAQISDRPAYDGKELPRTPDRELHQRTAIVGGAWRLGHTLTHVSGTWHDAVNWYAAAPRTLHGLFARVGDEVVQMEAEILNLADRVVEEVPSNPLVPDGPRAAQPVTDFVGMPLPGRTFLLTLRWTP